MTYQEALIKERRWFKRVHIIFLYHNTKILAGKWTMRSTAKKLKISLGAVSEALKLAKALSDNPQLEFLTREEALKRIKQ